MQMLRLSSKKLARAFLIALLLGITSSLLLFSGSVQGLAKPERATLVSLPNAPVNPVIFSGQEVQTTEIIVDDQSSGFSPGGPSSSWYHSSSSDTTYNGHAYWTYAAETWYGSNTNNWGTWTPNLPTSGQWEVFAYIPYVITGRPDTTRARYQVHAASGNYVVERDQNNNTGWVSLGTYTFNAGTSGYVRLEDVTPDWSYQGQRKTIKFDAIKWVLSGGSQPGVNVSIWVDRGEGGVYKVGDPLRLCYSVSRPIYIKVYDCQPGQSCRVILEGNDDGTGDCLNYTVNPPTGWETVRIEAIENNQVVAQDETYFYVTDDVDTEPPSGYCHVRWIDAVSNTCSGEFGLDSPQRIPLFSDYKYRPSPDVVEFGPFNPDTSLTFYIRPWGSCGGEYLSTSANAHITDLGTNRWRIAWEDLPPSRADDYNDLIVEVECGLQTESCEDSYEPDDSYGQANWISVNGGGQTHRFCDAGDQDWLKFSATSGTEYSIQTYFLGSESDTYLYLYDTNGVTELAHDDDGAEENRASRITWTAPQNGTYYIMVRQYDQGEYGPNTNYDISVQAITYFSIGGRVTDDGGASVSGATISLTGPSNLSTTSEPDGRYSFYNLPAGTYSLSASKARYTSPPARNVTVPPNTDNVNFVLQRLRYSISGRVTDSNNNPVSGVTISAGAGHTAITDSNGNYTLNGLLAGTHTLTPSKSEHTFSPTSRTVSVPPSASGQDFTASIIPDSSCDPGPDGVVLYEDVNYQGRCITLTADDPNLTDNGINDVVSSIKFVGNYRWGWKAVVYEHADYNGIRSTFTQSDPDFGNHAIGHDQASSVSVCADRDGDGLCNEWELNGYNGIDLPAMGADPNHKDIFVEIDYMEDPGFCTPLGCIFGHSHKPKPEAIAKVVEAFKNAPVSNPDGVHGIDLHVDFGRETPMTTRQGTPVPWNNRSRSNSLEHVEPLGSSCGTRCYRWNDFNAIKAANFERGPVFHYVVFAHLLGGFGTTSGIANGRGSDFIVSLGGADGDVGTVNDQAGTFMHELGHDLGLGHGGGDDTNHKPNYLSVMNYFFQFDGVTYERQEGRFDYSRSDKIPPLVENDLDEGAGLNGGSSTSSYGTRWYCSGNIQWTDSTDEIDWNCNGRGNEVGVSVDLNNEDGPTETLNNHFDWIILDYSDGGYVGGPSAGQSTQSNYAPAQESIVPKELTIEEARRIPSPYRVSVFGPGNLRASPGVTNIYKFQVSNLGFNRDVYNLDVSSSRGWADLSGVPARVTLEPRESIEVPIRVTLPLSAKGGQLDELKLVARSQSSPQIFDAAYTHTSAVSSVYIPFVRK